VTLLLRYCRAGAPCGGASAGMVNPGSGCADAARDAWPVVVSCAPMVVRSGVPVRPPPPPALDVGAGLAALCGACCVAAVAAVAGVVVPAGAGD
jgi:hypothetical protein